MQIFNLFVWVPLVILAMTLAQGRLQFGRKLRNFISQSRARFVWLALTVLMGANAFGFIASWGSLPPGSLGWEAYSNLIANSLWDLSLIVLIAWLMPAVRPRRLKTV